MGNLSQRLRGVVSPLVLYRFLPGDEAAFLRVVSFVEVRVNGLFSGDGAKILYFFGGEGDGREAEGRSNLHWSSIFPLNCFSNSL